MSEADFKLVRDAIGALLLVFLMGSSHWIFQQLKGWDLSKFRLNFSLNNYSDKNNKAVGFWNGLLEFVGFFSNNLLLFLLLFRVAILLPWYIGLAIFHQVDENKLKIGIFDALKKAFVFYPGQDTDGHLDIAKIENAKYSDFLLVIWNVPTVFAEYTGIFKNTNPDGSERKDPVFIPLFVAVIMLCLAFTISNFWLSSAAFIISLFFVLRSFFKPKSYGEDLVDIFALFILGSLVLTKVWLFIPLMIPAIVNLYNRISANEQIGEGTKEEEIITEEAGGC